MDIPDDRFYTQNDMWCKLDDDQHVTIGLTEQRVGKMETVRYIELPDPGDDVLSTVGVVEVETDKEVIDIFSPFDGVVADIHGVLEEHPEYLREDPYGKGWLAQIRLDKSEETDKLLSAEDYAELVKRKR